MQGFTTTDSTLTDFEWGGLCFSNDYSAFPTRTLERY